jgi:hypothetical protein
MWETEREWKKDRKEEENKVEDKEELNQVL